MMGLGEQTRFNAERWLEMTCENENSTTEAVTNNPDGKSSWWVRTQRRACDRLDKLVFDSEGKMTWFGIAFSCVAVPVVVIVTLLLHPVAVMKMLIGVQPKESDYDGF